MSEFPSPSYLRDLDLWCCDSGALATHHLCVHTGPPFFPHARAYEYVSSKHNLRRRSPCKTRDEWDYIVWAELRFQPCAMEHPCTGACCDLGFSTMLSQLYISYMHWTYDRPDFCALTLLRRGERLNRGFLAKVPKQWDLEGTEVVLNDSVPDGWGAPLRQMTFDFYLRLPGAKAWWHLATFRTLTGSDVETESRRVGAFLLSHF